MIIAQDTTAPTAAELAHAAVFTADGYSDDDGVDHVSIRTEGAEPSPAMLAAQAAKANYSFSGYAQRRFAADMSALATHQMCVRSSALARLIGEAIELKKAEQSAADEHTLLQVVEATLKQEGGTPDEVAAAGEAEYAADKNYMAARAEVEAAAARVANGPFADVGDALIRADAYARLVGTQEDGEPDCDKDVVALRNSYRSALQEMDRLSKIDGDDAFDEGESRLRAVEAKLDVLNRHWEKKWGQVVTIPKDADPDLRRELDEAYAERDAARSLMYAGTPRDIGQLLSLMEIAFDHIGLVDVGSYEARDRNAGAEPLDASKMWRNEDDAHSRALALIARHAARLRDQAMPADWRDLMASVSLIPNGRDAVRRAFEKGMDADCLKSIQLRGHPTNQLPILIFDQPDGTYWIRPDAAFKGEAVQ